MHETHHVVGSDTRNEPPNPFYRRAAPTRRNLLGRSSCSSHPGSAPGRHGSRRQARILDDAYAALKRINRCNLMIGGSTWRGKGASVQPHPRYPAAGDRGSTLRGTIRSASRRRTFASHRCGSATRTNPTLTLPPAAVTAAATAIGAAGASASARPSCHPYRPQQLRVQLLGDTPDAGQAAYCSVPHSAPLEPHPHARLPQPGRRSPRSDGE